jgi:hypothetical protein
LSLDHWARLLGVNPAHFNGVEVPTFRQPVCDHHWFQYAWQNSDAVSREDVAAAIAEAEAQIELHLGYRLLPSWEEDEWRETARPRSPEHSFVSPWDARGYSEAVSTKWKQFLSGGIRSSDLVRADAPITWSDPDGDGYTERGTVTGNTTALNSCEIHLYYPGKNGDPRWEIKPVRVVVAGGVATVTFRRELAVLEDIQEAFTNDLVPLADGADDADFLATVDIYRVYNDPQRQVEFVWEPVSQCNVCGNEGCALCTYSTQWGCLHARGDRSLGQVVYTPATWNATDKAFDSAAWAIARRPDITRLWYYGGLRSNAVDCPDIEMDPLWARAVAIYAASILDRPPCSCNMARFERWQEDLSYIRGTTELAQYQSTAKIINNPFGPKRGAVYAWNLVQDTAAVRVALLA